MKRIAITVQMLGLLLGVACFAVNGFWAYQSESAREVVKQAQKDRSDQFDQKAKAIKSGKEKKSPGESETDIMSNPKQEQAQRKLRSLIVLQKRYSWPLIIGGVVGLMMAIVGMVMTRRLGASSSKAPAV